MRKAREIPVEVVMSDVWRLAVQGILVLNKR